MTIWVSIVYLILTDSTSYKFYTDLEFCRDMTQHYTLHTHYIVTQTCKEFVGTRQEYIEQVIMPRAGEIQTERL